MTRAPVSGGTPGVTREFVGLQSPTARRAGAGGHPCQGLYYRGVGRKPKVAMISAAEKINFRLQSSVDAAVIKAMADRHQIEGAIVDGPLALDVSLSEYHCKVKGLESPINGSADVLIFPNIETANTFYKSATILAGGKTAAAVVGAKAPIVLTSRADDDDSKYYSILLALLMASKKKGKPVVLSYDE